MKRFAFFLAVCMALYITGALLLEQPQLLPDKYYYGMLADNDYNPFEAAYSVWRTAVILLFFLYAILRRWRFWIAAITFFGVQLAADFFVRTYLEAGLMYDMSDFLLRAGIAALAYIAGGFIVHHYYALSRWFSNHISQPAPRANSAPAQATAQAAAGKPQTKEQDNRRAAAYDLDDGQDKERPADALEWWRETASHRVESEPARKVRQDVSRRQPQRQLSKPQAKVTPGNRPASANTLPAGVSSMSSHSASGLESRSAPSVGTGRTSGWKDHKRASHTESTAETLPGSLARASGPPQKATPPPSRANASGQLRRTRSDLAQEEMRHTAERMNQKVLGRSRR